ncbi:cystatin-A1 [Hydra vulgaris]|uniref:cystatin-A1 n=1 Tax=Hydra vulgaris TaxID=6087 RepID=UPI001F5EAAEF|nr:cystatin-A1 [Hydra vulgaris]
MSMPGGTTAMKDATDEVQHIIEKVKDQVLGKVNDALENYKAISFKTQVVAGVNYFIKVDIGNDRYIHLKVFRPLPFDNEKFELHSVQEHKSKEDELKYF